MGVEGGARTAREDVVGALLRFVRADKAGSVPLPTSLSAVALALHRRERATKNSKRETNIFAGRGMILSLNLLFLYNRNLFFPSSTGFCTFSLLEEKNCTKRKTGKGARKPSVPSDEPEHSSDSELYGESKEVVHSLLPCCGARKTLTLDGARLRFSTAATRPSPLHPPPAARRRAPPSTPKDSRVSRPEAQLTCIRARLEY